MTEEDRVRALLAEQGSSATDEQIPPEVADRLEDTLALLAAERAAEVQVEGGGRVVPLRRRWLPRTLVAAAAVVVLAAGGASIAGLGGLPSPIGGSESSSSADSAGGSGDPGAAVEPDTTTSEKGLVESAPSEGAAQLQRDLVTGTVPSLASQSFARDVRRLLAAPSAGLRSAPSSDTSDSSPPYSSSPKPGSPKPGSPTPGGPTPGTASTACAGPALDKDATSTPIVLDGSLAALVVQPPANGRRVVEAWNCAGTTRLATTTVAP
ncbi:MAG: hypothetical protein ABIN79_09560 [Marmoricola sp.]